MFIFNVLSSLPGTVCILGCCTAFPTLSQSLHLYSRDDGDVHTGNRQTTSSVLTRLKQRAAGGKGKKTEEEEKKEAELHLYAVMPMSQIYFHLQRSWKSYIMVRDDGFPGHWVFCAC